MAEKDLKAEKTKKVRKPPSKKSVSGKTILTGKRTIPRGGIPRTLD